jgi:hypothetical protein
MAFPRLFVLPAHILRDPAGINIVMCRFPSDALYGFRDDEELINDITPQNHIPQ